MNGDELDKFIADILEAKKLSGVTNDVRVQLISDLKQQLLDQINRALIEALPEDKLDQFNHLLDDDTISDQVVEQFIVDSGIDSVKIATKTMLQFRDLYLESMDERT